MDLRDRDVPSDIASILRHQMSDENVMWYQPFIFTDDVATGTAAVWNAGADTMLCTPDDPPSFRESFHREARILADWYEYLVDIMVTAFPDADTFFDFGCNMGHFGFDLASRSKRYTGVDLARNEPGQRLLKEITGVDLELIAAEYSEQVHRIPDFDDERRFDVGIFSVVIMHLTDPHYAMPYFARKLNDGMFFSSLLVPGNDHHFKARIRPHNRGEELPDTFELVPTEPLAETLMRLSGFPHLYKLPYRDGQDPRHSKAWGCWLASRQPIDPTTVDRFHLTSVEDRVWKYVDGARPLAT